MSTRGKSSILAINAWLRGWHQFFRTCSPGEQFTLRALDAHIRRRLRAILLHHWKRRPTIVRNLIALGVKPRAAWQGVYSGRRSLWALSHIAQVDRALRPRFFTDRGLDSLVELHRRWHEENVGARKRRSRTADSISALITSLTVSAPIRRVSLRTVDSSGTRSDSAIRQKRRR